MTSTEHTDTIAAASQRVQDRLPPHRFHLGTEGPFFLVIEEWAHTFKVRGRFEYANDARAFQDMLTARMNNEEG